MVITKENFNDVLSSIRILTDKFRMDIFDSYRFYFARPVTVNTEPPIFAVVNNNSRIIKMKSIHFDIIIGEGTNIEFINNGFVITDNKRTVKMEANIYYPKTDVDYFTVSNYKFAETVAYKYFTEGLTKAEYDKYSSSTKTLIDTLKLVENIVTDPSTFQLFANNLCPINIAKMVCHSKEFRTILVAEIFIGDDSDYNGALAEAINEFLAEYKGISLAHPCCQVLSGKLLNDSKDIEWGFLDTSEDVSLKDVYVFNYPIYRTTVIDFNLAATIACHTVANALSMNYNDMCCMSVDIDYHSMMVMCYIVPHNDLNRLSRVSEYLSCYEDKNNRVYYVSE